MNISEIRELMLSMKPGDTLQHQMHNGDWVSLDSNFVGMNHSRDRYRIKPTPTLRPWRAEEVPVGAIVKSGVNRWLITAVWNGKLFMNGCDLHDDERSPSLSTLASLSYTHSLDHGKTWLPCGVME